jgi:hypothetical protein
MIMMAATAHEKIAAGPASADALNAPNSQPDPMMDPIAVNFSATGPSDRFILCTGCDAVNRSLSLTDADMATPLPS